MPESLFLIKLHVSILQLNRKKKLRCRCFLMNFARHLIHLFYRIPPGDFFCSEKKYFCIKIVKIALKKEKTWKLLVTKTTIHPEKKLKHYLHQVFISFYVKISLFHFSLLPMIHWKHVLLETMQSHWQFIYYRKLLLSFGNLTLISVSTGMVVKTNNKHME